VESGHRLSILTCSCAEPLCEPVNKYAAPAHCLSRRCGFVGGILASHATALAREAALERASHLSENLRQAPYRSVVATGTPLCPAKPAISLLGGEQLARSGAEHPWLVCGVVRDGHYRTSRCTTRHQVAGPFGKTCPRL